jgi:hypothetical protein
MAEAVVPSRRNLHTGERIVLEEHFLQKPGINADIAIAYNLDWEVLGTNAVSADVAFATGGGITLSTHGAATDSTIILPHLDTGQTSLTSISFAPSTKPQFVTTIKTPSSLTNTTFWLGFKLTNTPTTATDDDQVFFKYVNGTDTYWQCLSSIAGTDTATASTSTVAASTTYTMWITVDANRYATFWIDGVAMYTTAALTAAAAFIPYIGVLSATNATVKSLTVRNVELSVTR